MSTYVSGVLTLADTRIETAKLKGVYPQAWLTDTLDRIADHKTTDIDEPLPWPYAQNHHR